MRRADHSKKTKTEPWPEALGKKLVCREVIYALACKGEDDRLLRGLKMMEQRKWKRCGSGGAASWIPEKAREHACGRNELVEER